MAEFKEVMRQLNRMCMAHHNCEDDKCPIQEMECCGNIGSHCSEPIQTERIEKTVMAWAAEHPEPVYPTWGWWLEKNGLIRIELDPIVLSSMVRGIDDTDYIPIKKKMIEHIPADIAEKLGIEPLRR